MRNLAKDSRFPIAVVHELERLPDFRNVLVHDYVSLDMARVVDALDGLAPVEEFHAIVSGLPGL